MAYNARRILAPCGRARVRGTAACTCQGLWALPGLDLCVPSLRVVDFIGSSQACWFAERFFPLTPALSPRRGRTVRRALANPERLDSSPRRRRCSLRGGSGRGGRNTRSFSSNVFKAFPSPRPSPLVPRGEREKTKRRFLPCLCRLSCRLLSRHEITRYFIPRN